STTTSALPTRLYRLRVPSEPTLATTRLGTVTPATQFRSEAFGLVPRPGNTVRWLAAEVFVTVTLTTTAVGGVLALIRGTVPMPATATFSTPFPPRVRPALGLPAPARVSVI